ncbi:substrate-binding domain-containing protein [Catenuloplanes japonicus]|uniref:substrate-binding domain-containing protein n=1 Tax=Catenuloplanes japonicus TaxID=33876 RepID=UPI000525CF7C|nr:substrate-binding domain-containing protein [Catenuloplanes japonicus]
MAVVAVISGSYLGYRQLSQPSCTGSVPLVIAAAPEIVAPIKAAADTKMAAGAAVDGKCLEVTVNAAEPVEIAAAIATKHATQLTGVGQGSGTTVLPDVWVPDSSTWLQRLKQAAPGFSPLNAQSVATSPVVVAMPEPIAKTTVGWPDKKLQWTDLLAAMTSSDSALKPGIVDPALDASGLSGLLALGQAAGSGNDAARVGVLRTLALNRSNLRADLVAKFPKSGDPAALANGVGLAALSEEDVIAYNATKPPVSLAALYVEPAAVALDYPFAVMPEADAARGNAADLLFGELAQSGAYRDALGRAGLRGSDGAPGGGFAAPTGAPSPASIAASAPASSGGAAANGLDATAIGRALASWTAITSPGRMLVVFDVSGSMLGTVPTAGGKTRNQVMVEAAGRGLALLDNEWWVGVWVFSTELNGQRDYRELVPVGQLTKQKDALQASLGQVRPVEGGATGLYDTVLASYLEVQEGYQADKVNSVVLFTDGQNEDANSISREDLIKQLKEKADPKRPIRVILVGIGNEVNKEELESVAEAGGGGAYVAQDPAKIDEIFLQAIASRAATVG